VEEALPFFEAFPKVRSKLQTLHDVGLGYIKLGQPATTLSGGEAQRVKLSTELSRRATGRTLYILDEPTTGLSFEDVNALMRVLHRLVDAGNTVLVIEHHLDVVKQADHVIDLGPLGGDRGGAIVAEGTPEAVAKVKGSLTGRYLKDVLARGRAPAAAKGARRRQKVAAGGG
jgi:excinuclease ABC subunit A